MYERKTAVAVHKARRRVMEFERQAAPWPWRNRARRQLKKVEAETTRTVKE